MSQFDSNDYFKPKREHSQTNYLALFSVLSGILSVLLCLTVTFSFFMGMLGIVLAITSKKEVSFSSTAIAGLVLSIIGVLCSLGLFALFLVTINLLKDPEYAALFRQLLEQYQQQLNFPVAFLGNTL